MFSYNKPEGRCYFILRVIYLFSLVFIDKNTIPVYNKAKGNVDRRFALIVLMNNR